MRHCSVSVCHIRDRKDFQNPEIEGTYKIKPYSAAVIFPYIHSPYIW